MLATTMMVLRAALPRLSLLLPFIATETAFAHPDHAISTEPPKRILYLSSYHITFPTTKYVLENIFEEYHRPDRNSAFTLDVYMMDTKRYSPEERFPVVHKDLKEKVQKLGKFDIIISADDNALHFLEAYKDEIFEPSTPVVFHGINNFAFGERMALKPDYTGILENSSLLETVHLAFRVLPDLENLHVIVDATPSGSALLNSFENEVTGAIREQCTIIHLEDFTYEEASSKISRLDANDALLFLCAFCDSAGTRLNFQQVLIWLNQHAEVPVFRPYRHGIGEGMIGGKVTSHDEIARLSFEYAHRILDGQAASELPLIRSVENVYVFDYNALSEAGINTSRLPTSATILGKPDSILERFGWWLLGLAIISILILSVTVIMSVLYARERRAVKQFQESEYRMASLFANSFAPMFLINLNDDRIVRANTAACSFYGYSEQEFLQLKRADITLTTAEEHKENLLKLERNTKYVVRTTHRCASGEPKEVESILTPIELNQEAHLFIIVQDRTTELRWARETLQAKESAERANQSKDTFLSLMSHELRTPLTPILGLTSAVIEETYDEMAKEQLGYVLSSGERMLELVDNILEYVDIESRRLNPTPVRFRIDEILEEIQSEYASNANGNSIQILHDINVGPGADITHFTSDPIAIRGILEQLVNNAVKFTQKGFIMIRCDIDGAHGKEDTASCRLEIEDNGIGIREEKLEDLLKPFHQQDHTRTRTYEGAGLGLAIVKAYVEQLEGTIEAFAAPEGGSRFVVKFDLEIPEGSVVQERS